MTLLKSITLLLVAAIANPMCCCLSFAEMDLESAPKASADPHACCKVADEASSQKASTPNGDHDCPHEELKLSQIKDNPSDQVTISKGSVDQRVDFLEAASLYLTPSNLAKRDIQARSASTRPTLSGESYPQKYCVFIL